MPRLAILDVPGVLHHVMGRGIKRKQIFWNNKDRDDFIERLAALVEKGMVISKTGLQKARHNSQEASIWKSKA